MDTASSIDLKRLARLYDECDRNYCIEIEHLYVALTNDDEPGVISQRDIDDFVEELFGYDMKAVHDDGWLEGFVDGALETYDKAKAVELEPEETAETVGGQFTPQFFG